MNKITILGNFHVFLNNNNDNWETDPSIINPSRLNCIAIDITGHLSSAYCLGSVRLQVTRHVKYVIAILLILWVSITTPHQHPNFSWKTHGNVACVVGATLLICLTDSETIAVLTLSNENSLYVRKMTDVSLFHFMICHENLRLCSINKTHANQCSMVTGTN